ncbi:MAG: hypothetical protein KDI42_09065, partial [Gammaproteobacteria bacterium]|nr:hypothetical protein [Gammaproteobacteria bacterium]
GRIHELSRTGDAGSDVSRSGITTMIKRSWRRPDHLRWVYFVPGIGALPIIAGLPGRPPRPAI